MIKTIEVLIRNGINVLYNAIIVNDKNIMYLNDKKYTVPKEYINDIISTIYMWDENYGYDNKIDTEEFMVTVTSDKDKKKICGKGHYPSNYEHLKEMLGSINE